MPQITRHIQISVFVNIIMNQLMLESVKLKTSKMSNEELKIKEKKLSSIELTWQDLQGLSWIFEEEE